MAIKDAILATIAAEKDGELRGRTLLQKKLYFVSVLTQEDFGFLPYYYGPYSAMVADELGALVNAGFVQEEVDVYPEITGPFGERRLYRYKVNDSVEELLRQRDGQMAAYSRALERINSYPISQNAHLLSIAAKVHLIVSERGEATAAAITRRAQELGWDLNDRGVSQVVAYLELVGLVRKA